MGGGSRLVFVTLVSYKGFLLHFLEYRAGVSDPSVKNVTLFFSMKAFFSGKFSLGICKIWCNNQADWISLNQFCLATVRNTRQKIQNCNTWCNNQTDWIRVNNWILETTYRTYYTFGLEDSSLTWVMEHSLQIQFKYMTHVLHIHKKFISNL